MENNKQSVKISVSTSTVFKIIGIFLLLYVFYLVSDILMLLFISLVLASAVDPWVDWLQAKKLPRSLAVILIYLIFFSVILLDYLNEPEIELRLAYQGACVGCSIASTGTYEMIKSTIEQVIDKRVRIYVL